MFDLKIEKKKKKKKNRLEIYSLQRLLTFETAKITWFHVFYRNSYIKKSLQNWIPENFETYCF